jgi:hypothetical protein
MMRRPAKERARFLADFSVTTKENKWQYALKSARSSEIVIVHLASPRDF